MSLSQEYTAWRAMKCRCSKPGSLYVKKGIKVCQRWLNSFENFFEDVGKKPAPGLYLDRINNDGNYEPGNCRWVTSKVSANNRCNHYSYEKHVRGERVATHKVTEQQVREIRRLRESGLVYQKIGDMFGISKRMAINICARKNWQHVA